MVLICLVAGMVGQSSLSAAIFDIGFYGAKPDDGGDDTAAIQRAIDRCAEAGGGTVNFPTGTFHSGTVFLRSNVSIYLRNGAVWKGVNAVDAYPPIEPPVPSREDREPRRAMIYGHQVKNVKLFGEGTLYPGGDYEIWEADRENKKYYLRPFGLHLVESQDITVEGLTMKNSPFWMQRYFHCDRVRLSGLTIYNHSNLNNDGIDIDGCHDVVIDNCIIDSSDDALVLKSEGARAVEDVVITNCILSSHATPLKCGTGSIGGFKRITISNIVIRPSKSKEMHHVLEAWGGLSGIDLLNVDGGVMEDILIDNVVIHGTETPIFIKLGNRHSGWDGKPEATPGLTRNISISNLIARDCGPIASAITGYPGNPVHDVRLSNIDISMRGKGPAGAAMEPVPEHSDRYPYNRMFGSDLPAYGLFLRHVNGLRVDNVRLSYGGTEERPALHLEQARDVVFRGLEAQVPAGDQPVARLANVRNVRFIDGDLDADQVEMRDSRQVRF